MTHFGSQNSAVSEVIGYEQDVRGTGKVSSPSMKPPCRLRDQPAYHLINGNREPNLHFPMYLHGVHNEKETFAF